MSTGDIKIKKRERMLLEPEEVQASEGSKSKVGKIILPPKNSLSARVGMPVGMPLANTDEEAPLGLLSQQKFGHIVTHHDKWLNDTLMSMTIYQELSN
jgi:hypothetical protein